MREAACQYALDGWKVFPCLPKSKQPDGRLCPNGYKDATNNVGQVLEWWTENPSSNIGFPCKDNGLVVVDYDGPEGYDEIYEGLKKYGNFPSATVKTANGHHYYMRDPGVPLVGKYSAHVDIKSNGYVLAPPSTHPLGTQYKLLYNRDFSKINSLPDAWIKRLEKKEEKREYGEPNLPILQEEIRNLPIGLGDIEFRQGREWVRCPFHKNGQERTPSLCLDGRLWYCFACQIGGNAIDLLGRLDGFEPPFSKREVREILGEFDK